MGKLDEMANKILGGSARKQELIDRGQLEWSPDMEGLLPAVGTGVRPANMPAWAKDSLPPLRQGYGERIQQAPTTGQAPVSSTDLAAALRASAPAQAAAPSDWVNSGGGGDFGGGR